MREKKVLLIDDEEDMDWLLKKILNEAGYDCLTATTGKEGVEIFDMFSKEIGAVILDLKLPDMNGWEVARYIKQISPDTPVAMVTGWHVGLNEEKMKVEGVDLVVNKPFEMDKLRRVMAEALELKSRM